MDDIIIVTDENGVEQEYEVLDTVEFEGASYMVLIQEGDTEVSVLRVDSDDGDELRVESCEDDTAEEVYHIFKDRNLEKFDFDD